MLQRSKQSRANSSLRGWEKPVPAATGEIHAASEKLLRREVQCPIHPKIQPCLGILHKKELAGKTPASPKKGKGL